MTIVRTSYRYKRPPRKRKAVALEMPTTITKPTRRLPEAAQNAPASRRSSPRRTRIDVMAGSPTCPT